MNNHPVSQNTQAPEQRYVPLPVENQDSLDWINSFLPPALRITHETLAIWNEKITQYFTISNLSHQYLLLLQFIQYHWRFLTLFSLLSSIWVFILYWIHYNAMEFTAAYIIISGFFGLLLHVCLGNTESLKNERISAYSVFNRGMMRILGTLSVEQIENELRHRHPGQMDIPLNENERHESNEPNEQTLQELEVKLQEIKRKARQERRNRRR